MEEKIISDQNQPQNAFYLSIATIFVQVIEDPDAPERVCLKHAFKILLDQAIATDHADTKFGCSDNCLWRGAKNELEKQGAGNHNYFPVLEKLINDCGIAEDGTPEQYSLALCRPSCESKRDILNKINDETVCECRPDTDFNVNGIQTNESTVFPSIETPYTEQTTQAGPISSGGIRTTRPKTPKTPKSHKSPRKQNNKSKQGSRKTHGASIRKSKKPKSPNSRASIYGVAEDEKTQG